MTDFRLLQGDCLDHFSSIPSGSIDLVLCDPPYGTMAGAALDGWSGVKTDWDVALKPQTIFPECNRVLRMNGALLLFSQEPYTSKLITEACNDLPFCYRLIWLKDHFANALIAKKAPVSYFEDILVFVKKYDTLNLHPLREYSRQVLAFCGGNLKDVNTKLGHRRVEHFFYIHSTQFGLCTEPTYIELCSAYGIDAEPWFKPYAELVDINQRFIRCFNLPEGQRFKSNVLSFSKDYSGYHPTQKPVALLSDLITTYSNVGDTVLDFTMGSGSTGVACSETNRSFIGIEMDPNYFEVARQRIEKARGL